MTRKLFGLFISLLLSWALDVHAQGTISGKVVAASNNQPVSGASVLLKGKTSGASTNPEGVFSIAAKVGDILVVSGVGIQTYEHVIKQVGLQLISVEVETTQLNEVVTLDEVQQDKVFALMARSSDDYDPAMQLQGLESDAVLEGSSRDEAIMEVLTPEQKVLFEADRQRRREAASKGLEAIGIKPPSDPAALDALGGAGRGR